MSSRAHLGALLLAALALFPAGTAQAQQQLTAKITVSAIVIANCRLMIEPLAFGRYDPVGVNSTVAVDATSTVTVACTRDARATIMMDGGQNGGPSNRWMTMGDQRLSYQIFRDAARTEVWGKGGGAVQVVSTGLFNPQKITIYGRLAPAQEVGPGTYTDLVTATVDF